jgi:hypothetical protein
MFTIGPKAWSALRGQRPKAVFARAARDGSLEFIIAVLHPMVAMAEVGDRDFHAGSGTGVGKKPCVTYEIYQTNWALP